MAIEAVAYQAFRKGGGVTRAVPLFNLGQADASARSEDAVAALMVVYGAAAIADRRQEQVGGGVRIARADEASDGNRAGDRAPRMGSSRVQGQPPKVGLSERLEQDLQRPGATLLPRIVHGVWFVNRGKLVLSLIIQGQGQADLG